MSLANKYPIEVLVIPESRNTAGAVCAWLVVLTQRSTPDSPAGHDRPNRAIDVARFTNEREAVSCQRATRTLLEGLGDLAEELGGLWDVEVSQ